jgi:hypothetical protein
MIVVFTLPAVILAGANPQEPPARFVLVSLYSSWSSITKTAAALPLGLSSLASERALGRPPRRTDPTAADTRSGATSSCRRSSRQRSRARCQSDVRAMRALNVSCAGSPPIRMSFSARGSSSRTPSHEVAQPGIDVRLDVSARVVQFDPDQGRVSRKRSYRHLTGHRIHARPETRPPP